jgi:hypothetical protein
MWLLIIMAGPDFGIFSVPCHVRFVIAFKIGITILAQKLKVGFVPRGLPVGGAYVICALSIGLNLIAKARDHRVGEPALL